MTVARSTFEGEGVTGLKLDALTGAVSGMCTTVTAEADYIFTASNCGGKCSKTMALRCDAQPPMCVALNQSYTCGAAVEWDVLVPENFLVGGAKYTQTISPTVMPTSMVWDDKNGVISGTAVEPN